LPLGSRIPARAASSPSPNSLLKGFYLSFRAKRGICFSLGAPGSAFLPGRVARSQILFFFLVGDHRSEDTKLELGCYLTINVHHYVSHMIPRPVE